MAADSEATALGTAASSSSCCLQKFRLYETHMKFYIVGSDNNKTQWRVLIIDRLEPSELNIHEDPTTYSTVECNDLLKRVHEGNIATGGLKFVTKCYGIVGFVKFLGPYYMLLITKRRKIGNIYGHAVYGVSKSEMIIIPNSTVRSAVTYSKDENSYTIGVITVSGGLSVRFNFTDNFRSPDQYLDCCKIYMIPGIGRNTYRYKKLLCTVDLTKDFFFSYSYNIMRSLQKNLYDGITGQVLYETMFVWNEFLTRGVRMLLKNTTWTVALIHGFFKQVKLSACGKNFKFTLIARRSRHFAGTRYLKRGVNEKGRVANDVETEQIVCEDTVEEMPSEITSVVQNRGSIPLFWSQETSKLNIRPDIVLHKNKNFEATRLHFENLVKRYGNPIIILNLIKSCEKKPRESLLRAEFSNAIDLINKDLPGEKRLKFLHWDIQKQSRRKGENVLEMLGKVAEYALNLTGIFYRQLPPSLKFQDVDLPTDIGVSVAIGSYGSSWRDEGQNSDISQSEYYGDRTKHDVDNSANEIHNPATSHNDYSADEFECKVNLANPPRLQSGVLRTNCIDCLDRTNVAQYAYGLAALGQQLHALGYIDVPKVDPDSPLADDMMDIYERMGDTLSLQYGGSAAHNKIFSERRGQWKAATQSQELLRTIQRYYRNAYMDAEKQDAINLFLGHFQPHQGKPALWELSSDQHYSTGRHNARSHENSRSFIKRSMSDGNILCDSQIPMSICDSGSNEPAASAFPTRIQQDSVAKGLCDSTPEISTCDNDIQYYSYMPTFPRRQIVSDNGHICFSKHRFNDSNCSNFLDFDWLSSSSNSCEDEGSDRSSMINSPMTNVSTENVLEGDEEISSLNIEGAGIETMVGEAKGRQASESSKAGEFSDRFTHWVAYGGTLCF